MQYNVILPEEIFLEILRQLPDWTKALLTFKSKERLGFWLPPQGLILRTVSRSWLRIIDRDVLPFITRFNLSEMISQPKYFSIETIQKELDTNFVWNRILALNLSYFGGVSVSQVECLKFLPQLCPYLQKLYLCHMQTELDIDVFPMVISKLSHLEELYLTDTNISPRFEKDDLNGIESEYFPPKLRFVELSYKDAFKTRVTRSLFSSFVKRLRPDIEISMHTSSSPLTYINALVLCDTFNCIPPHLPRHFCFIQDLLRACAFQQDNNAFSMAVESMTERSKSFWRGNLNDLIISGSFDDILLKSGLATAEHLLWEKFRFYHVESREGNKDASMLEMITNFFKNHPNIDFSQFYDKETKMSLVGALCKAKVPKDLAIKTLVFAKVIEHTESGDYVCKSPNLINASGEYHPFYFLLGSGPNQLDLMIFLISLGGNVNAIDQKGHSLLYHSLTWGNAEWVEVLIHHGAKVDWESLAVITSKDLGGNRNESDEYRSIAKVGDLLIKNATSVVLNTRNTEGKTLVEITAAERPEWLMELLRHGTGIDPQVPSSLKIFCSNFAKHLRSVPSIAYDCVELLVKHQKRHCGEKSMQMYNFLDIALSSFNLLNFWTYVVTPKMIQLFVSLGCDINFQNEFGKTTYHWAYMTGKQKLINLCQELGARDDIKDLEGRYPHDCIRKGKNLVTMPGTKNK